MNKLFNTTAQMTIAGTREFNAPPFAIEFEQSFEIGKPSSTTAKLYNPAPDTIKACEAIRKGRSFTYPTVSIDAGYVESQGTCVLGEIIEYKVSQSGPDKVLEMKISDKTSRWANALINKTWRNTKASVILSEMLSSVGIDAGAAEFGQDKLYKTLSVRYLKNGIKKIARDTNSEFYFDNGVFTMVPQSPRQKKVISLAYDSGLIERPEKTKIGVKFNTLFMYQIVINSYVQITTDTINGIFRVRRGKKTFSTIGSSQCEFEGVEI